MSWQIYGQTCHGPVHLVHRRDVNRLRMHVVDFDPQDRAHRRQQKFDESVVIVGKSGLVPLGGGFAKIELYLESHRKRAYRWS